MGMLERWGELHLTRDRQGRRIHKGGCFGTHSYLVESEADHACLRALARQELGFTLALLILLPVLLASIDGRGLRWVLGAALVILLAIGYSLSRRRLESRLRRAEA